MSAVQHRRCGSPTNMRFASSRMDSIQNRGQIVLPSKAWRNLLWYVRTNPHRGNPSRKTTRRRLTYLGISRCNAPCGKKFFHFFSTLSKRGFSEVTSYIDVKLLLRVGSPTGDLPRPALPARPAVAVLPEVVAGGSPPPVQKTVVSTVDDEPPPLPPRRPNKGKDSIESSRFLDREAWIRHLGLFVDHYGVELLLQHALPGPGRVTLILTPEETRAARLLIMRDSSDELEFDELALSSLITDSVDPVHSRFWFHGREHICSHSHEGCHQSDTVGGFVDNNPWALFGPLLLLELDKLSNTLHFMQTEIQLAG